MCITKGKWLKIRRISGDKPVRLLAEALFGPFVRGPSDLRCWENREHCSKSYERRLKLGRTCHKRFKNSMRILLFENWAIVILLTEEFNVLLK